jgi:hypothetical protein
MGEFPLNLYLGAFVLGYLASFIVKLIDRDWATVYVMLIPVIMGICFYNYPVASSIVTALVYPYVLYLCK